MSEEKKTNAGQQSRTGSTGSRRSAAPRKRRRRTMASRVSGALLYVLFIIGVSAILATLGWSWANDVLALNKEPVTAAITLPDEIFTQEEQKVEREGEDGVVTVEMATVNVADMDYVADLLKENGLIEYKFLFKLFAAFTGADAELSAGTYELDSDMDYRALLTNMGRNSAAMKTVDVTIPEGYTVDQIFALLEEKGVASVEELQEVAATHDYRFEWLVPLEIPLGDYHRLEGFLFPDTYEFYMGQDPLYVINKMLQGFDAKIMPYLEEINANEDYDLYDLVTIASMIEKETDGEDQAKIASVIYNRLENTGGGTYGYLQIDATLVYINGGNVPTEADKEIDSPYNTYKYQGLPAGPISNPGMEALYAAMKPESTKYYYYVLNPETNRHEFSTTYSAHQALVDKYSNG